MKSESEIRERIAEAAGNDAVLLDGYDDCILGTVRRYGMEPVVVYDEEKVIRKLMADGMSYEEAVEFFDFNQIGAWVGDKTPCFLSWALPSQDGVFPVTAETEIVTPKKDDFPVAEIGVTSV